MSLIKSAIERGAAVARGSEGHLLIRVIRIRGTGVIGGDQFCNINKIRGLCQCAGALVGHSVLLRSGDDVYIQLACSSAFAQDEYSPGWGYRQIYSISIVR